MKLEKLSAQTKLVIVVVLVLAVGAGYYFGVYRSFKNKEESIRTSIQDTQAKIDAEQTKIASINARKRGIEEGKTLGSIVYPSDNSNAESALLSSILKRNTESFSYAFGASPDNGTYVRRGVSLSCSAAEYENVRTAMDEICSSGFRNIISGVQLSGDDKEGLSTKSGVSCSYTVTFIESVKDTTPQTEPETKKAQN